MVDILTNQPKAFMIPREYIGTQPIVDYFYVDLNLGTFDNVFAPANSDAFCVRSFMFKLQDSSGTDLKYFGEYSDSGGPQLVFKLSLADF